MNTINPKKFNKTDLDDCANNFIKAGEQSGIDTMTSVEEYKALKLKGEEYAASISRKVYSSLTEAVILADQKRDFAYIGLRRYAGALCYSPDTAVREAAGKIKIRLDLFGAGIESLSYTQESSSLRSVISELRKPEYASEVGTMNLHPWIDELEQKEIAFEAVNSSKRDDHLAWKETESATSLRLGLAKAIVDYYIYVSSMALISKDAQWNSLLQKLNESYETIARNYTRTARPKAEVKTV